ncbi:MAG: hypothetical protein ACLFMQ_01645 [Desulfohalobiaceae bacterium]
MQEGNAAGSQDVTWTIRMLIRALRRSLKMFLAHLDRIEKGLEI